MTTPRPLSFDLQEPLDTTALVSLADEITNIIQEWPNVGENDLIDIKLQLSIAEYVMLATAIDVGRDIAFAEDSEVIWVKWLKAFKGFCNECEEGDCISYPSSANIITYSPQNPFSEPDLVPDGYLTPPFTLFKNFPLVGWLSTYFPEFTEGLTGYQPNDVIVDISSIPTGSWTEPALGMPQISIAVSGNGIVELHMLNFPLGGRAIVTIDVQPNVGDILGGILGNAEFSVELNRDIISIPPETVSEVIFEVKIEDEIPTNHTIYITFVPTVDDALIPINFGGGLRSIVLCGLDEEIMPIVEDVRINNCVLEVMINGQWIVKGSVSDCITAITNPMQAQINTNIANIANNANAITALQNADVNLQSQITANSDTIDSLINVDLPQINTAIESLDGRTDTLEANIAQNNGILSDHEQRIVILENAGNGGGSAGVRIRTTSYAFEIPSNQTISSQTFVPLLGQDHTFIYPNVMIFAEIKAAHLGQNLQYPEFRIRLENTAIPQDVAVGDKFARAVGTSFVSTEVIQVFEDLISIGDLDIVIDWRSSDGGNVRVQGSQLINIGVIEYELPPAAPEYLVTFDAGGDDYTDGLGSQGTVQANGNPDNAYAGTNITFGSNVGILINFAEQQSITGLRLDGLSSTAADTALIVRFRLSGNIVDTITVPAFLTADSTWQTYILQASYPIVADEIWVRLENDEQFTSIADMRMDNVLISLEE